MREQLKRGFSVPHEKFESLVNSIDGIVWEANPETFQFTFVSRKAEKILGYPVEEWLQNPSFWTDHIHPDDKEWAVTYCRNATKEGKGHELEYRMIAKDNSVVWLHDIVTVVCDKNIPVQLHGIMVDITEKKKAEEMMRVSHQHLLNSEILGKTGYWFYDVKNNKFNWSEGTCRIFGVSPGEETFERFVNMIHPGDVERVKKTIRSVYETKKPTTCEYWIKTPGDQNKYIGNSIELSLDDNGEIPYVFGNTIDLTERKKANDEIEQSYKEIRRLTEYLENVREKERTYIAREIHNELGQRLTVLKMNMTWLHRKMEKQEPEIIQKINKLTLLLDETMQTVRRISYSLRPGILDDLGLIAAIEWHLIEFTKYSGVKSFFQHSEDNIMLPDAFNVGVFRIFQESLTNVARHAQASKVTVTLDRKDNSLFLSIEDDGVGFDQNSIARNTLGLLGMKERAYMMGGEYHINSLPGKGTSVTISIPEHRLTIKPIAIEN